MAYTFGEIMTRARGLLYEVQGTPAAEDPMGWAPLICNATDETSRRTFSLFLNATTDVTSATALYCVPASFWKLRTVQEQNDQGNWSELPIFDTPQMNRMFGAWWQNATPSDPAQAGVLDGSTFGVTLFPTPSVSRTAALLFGGLWRPGNVWGYTNGTAVEVVDSNGIPNMTATNPLPDWSQDCVIYGAAVQRCWQFPTPENMTRLPFLAQHYENLIGQAHAAAATYSPPKIYGFYAPGPMVAAIW
jgi:hypothetical protein